MRYFVVSQDERRHPFIIAEIVREFFDNGTFREASFASSLVGDALRIVLESELVRRPGGSAALAAWRSGDDALFDLETSNVLQTIVEEQEAAVRRRRMRVVSTQARPNAHVPDHRPVELRPVENVSELYARARLTVEQSSALVAYARQRMEERALERRERGLREREGGAGRRELRHE